MDFTEALYLGGVVAAFIVFIGALAWAARDYARSGHGRHVAAGED